MARRFDEVVWLFARLSFVHHRIIRHGSRSTTGSYIYIARVKSDLRKEGTKQKCVQLVPVEVTRDACKRASANIINRRGSGRASPADSFIQRANTGRL